ncbi:phage tail protein [Paenibacillus fonticola]|uniref:phage tail protein n=1 Tax=Paenibacillus fonticola TaxID=379896 RepID=UPI0003805FF4|nr:tail fiber protein [Paenibacillus fonticola]
MADAYTGEIRIFAGDFPPRGWALCNGQLLPIAQNTALYSVLGVQYGGDGKTTFALPNLTGAVPMHQGQGQGLTSRKVGQRVGSETVTLTESQIPAHTHIPQAVNAPGSANTAGSNIWAQSPREGRPGQQTQLPLYDSDSTTNMNPTALSPTGSSQPHNNMQPFLALNFIICLNGEYPSKD